MVKPKSRELIIVCDETARSQVKRKRHMRKVGDTSWFFDATRRNRKIHTVVKAQRANTDKAIQMQLVTSTKCRLSELDCIYDKGVADMLEHPKDFSFSKLDWKFQPFYNITKPGSKNLIMQADLELDEMLIVIPEIGRDIGVLKRATKELLSNKAHDVIAINTMPGHHAGPKKMTNYCSINNVAFAARQMKKINPRLKVGVIDIDVHPGDGTQAFVMKEPRLINKFFSIHSTRTFWKSRMKRHPNGSKIGFGANEIGLKKKQGEVAVERLLASIEDVMVKMSRTHMDVVIVSIGFDTLKNDPLAGKSLGFQMLPSDFYKVGRIFSQRPEQFFFVQEGGYDVTEVARSFDYLTKGFREGRKCLEKKSA